MNIHLGPLNKKAKIGLGFELNGEGNSVITLSFHYKVFLLKTKSYLLLYWQQWRHPISSTRRIFDFSP